MDSWDVGVDVRYLRQPHLGLAHAINAGVRASFGNTVFFGLDHTILGPNSLEAHAAPRSENNILCGRQMFLYQSMFADHVNSHGVSAERIGAYGHRSGNAWVRHAAELLGWCDRAMIPKGIANFAAIEYVATTTAQYQDIERSLCSGLVNHIRTPWAIMRLGNHSVHRSLFERVGGLDEHLDEHSGWYADIDLGLRMSLAGARFEFADAAVAVGLFHGAARKADYGRSTALAYLARKHRLFDILLLPWYLDNPNVTLREFADHAQAAQAWWRQGEDG